MFQSRLNSILNVELFDLSRNEPRTPQRFIHTLYITNDNRFSAYLNGTINNNNLQMQLYSISYNTRYQCVVWRLPLNEYEFYKTENGIRKPKLTDRLTEKIYSHLLPEFKESIEQVLLDYHILIDENNSIIPLSQYPRISYAIASFETFPLIYFQCKFSNADIEQLSQVICNCTVVSHHSHQTYRVYRFYELGTYNQWTLPVNEYLIPTICIITCTQSIERANELINILNRSNIETLIRILN